MKWRWVATGTDMVPFRIEVETHEGAAGREHVHPHYATCIRRDGFYVRQAIITKYLGPTNHRGSRVVAKAQAGRVVVSWNHGLDVGDNHRMAAIALCDKYGWRYCSDGWQMEGGALPDGTGYAFVIFKREPDVLFSRDDKALEAAREMAHGD